MGHMYHFLLICKFIAVKVCLYSFDPFEELPLELQ
jgi:hypothetical protein